MAVLWLFEISFLTANSQTFGHIQIFLDKFKACLNSWTYRVQPQLGMNRSSSGTLITETGFSKPQKSQKYWLGISNDRLPVEHHRLKKTDASLTQSLVFTSWGFSHQVFSNSIPLRTKYSSQPANDFLYSLPNVELSVFFNQGMILNFCPLNTNPFWRLCVNIMCDLCHPGICILRLVSICVFFQKATAKLPRTQHFLNKWAVSPHHAVFTWNKGWPLVSAD